MSRWTFLAYLLLMTPVRVHASGTDSPKVDAPDADQLQTPDESEPKGTESEGTDDAAATPAVTPISTFGADKDAHQQALDAMIQANDLRNKNQWEAASDAALEAYDDLGEMRHLRGAKRAKWRVLRHQAASLYIETGIHYVAEYVRHAGTTWDAQQEGRSRLEDLRDVAKEYPELDKMLNTAIQQIPNQKP